MQYNMNEIVAESDVVFITLDTLRYDVAQELWASNQLPNFSKWLSPNGWEERHSPGSFTYAAHHAFFAGFLPTPAQPQKHPRLFATKFAGSETAVSNTCTFDAANIVTGFQQKGFKTVCIGGVGFFNKKTPLSTVFPSFFQESHWEESFGVTDQNSTQHQFQKAAAVFEQYKDPIFLFLNISALHQPNYFYLPEAKEDSIESHAAALTYVDRQLPILMQALSKRQQAFVICCADHGTTYGEDGYTGHRIGHPNVWTVPYLEILLQQKKETVE